MATASSLIISSSLFWWAATAGENKTVRTKQENSGGAQKQQHAWACDSVAAVPQGRSQTVRGLTVQTSQTIHTRFLNY